ncbi:aminotransferase class I/II-fold pyridoxal phosphate-dependent enzyme [Streptomyces sp. NEAU-S77]|uniref:aminotransferase class I/II-fold pyridoxal phosphate-dependent enzyme n=1 Tax=Streptomyces sp. NEAU-S77 TaxID=3411033 RepID=UPI003B9FABF1
MVVETAVAALRDPTTHHYGTAQGGPALRALVATAIADDTGLSWSADDGQIALGVKHALFVATQALIDAGDEVLVAAPGWPGHAEVVTAASGIAVPVATDASSVSRPRFSTAAAPRAHGRCSSPAPATPPALRTQRPG